MAMTLDGKVMRPDGRWYGLSSKADRRRMDVYRAEADALIVGRNSVEKDNPVLRLADGRSPVPVMICRTALPPSDRHVFRDAPGTLVFAPPGLVDAAEKARGWEGVEFVPRTIAELSIRSVLEELYRRGYRNVLLEGGPALNHSFFTDDLVDTIHLTLVPFLIGQKDLPAVVDGPAPFPDFAGRAWDLEKCERIENEVFLTYGRRR